jgi:CTD small phosphatase-like protein 2
MDQKEESSKDQPGDIHERINRHPYRHLVGTTIDKESFKKHLAMLYRGTVYSVKFLKGPSEKYLNSKMLTLPEPKSNYHANTANRKKFLVLDLDETLIHTVQPREKSDVVLKLEGMDSLCFNIRPYCLEFLEKMSEHFAIYVFTASTPAYATPIIEHLNKKNKTIHGVLSRPHCMETRNGTVVSHSGFYIKDLRIIKNRNLKDIVMVDNLVHSFGLQIDNGIPIL